MDKLCHADAYGKGNLAVKTLNYNFDLDITDFVSVNFEQITDIAPDFYWYNFDAFGDFKYYSTLNSDGELVASVFMTFYCDEPKAFSVDIIFENVRRFEIGCMGVRTVLTGFDIMKVRNTDMLNGMNYRICSLEDDDINFFCESFRISNVQIEENKS